MAIRNRQGGCEVGEAVITNAGNLPTKKVIHTVGPVWNKQQSNEDEKLRNCYVNSLRLAEANGLTSIAFPKIERVVFVCFDVENFEIYEELLKDDERL